MKNDKYTKEQIGEMLFKSDANLINGLLRIYSHQTADEQHVKDVKYHNSKGFRPADARILSGMAEFYKKNGYLSPKQTSLVKVRMRKYVGQLTKFANGHI